MKKFTDKRGANITVNALEKLTFVDTGKYKIA